MKNNSERTQFVKKKIVRRYLCIFNIVEQLMKKRLFNTSLQNVSHENIIFLNF